MVQRHLPLGLAGGTALLGLLLLAACSLPQLEVRPVASIAGQRLEDPDASAYERGKEHLQEGRIGFALQAFRGALAENPHSVRVLNALAVSYDQLGRHDLAGPYFERALRIEPTSPQTLNNLGYSALRRGEVATAIGYFQRALDHGHGHPTIQANLQVAGVYGADAAALPHLAQVVESAPQVRPAAWVERTSAAVQTIVTRPDPLLLEIAAALGIEPRLASHHRSMP
jgi:Flp pilus assembly protein TadD